MPPNDAAQRDYRWDHGRSTPVKSPQCHGSDCDTLLFSGLILSVLPLASVPTPAVDGGGVTPRFACDPCFVRLVLLQFMASAIP